MRCGRFVEAAAQLGLELLAAEVSIRHDKNAVIKL